MTQNYGDFHKFKTSVGIALIMAAIYLPIQLFEWSNLAPPRNLDPSLESFRDLILPWLATYWWVISLTLCMLGIMISTSGAREWQQRQMQINRVEDWNVEAKEAEIRKIRIQVSESTRPTSETQFDQDILISSVAELKSSDAPKQSQDILADLLTIVNTKRENKQIIEQVFLEKLKSTFATNRIIENVVIENTSADAIVLFADGERDAIIELKTFGTFDLDIAAFSGRCRQMSQAKMKYEERFQRSAFSVIIFIGTGVLSDSKIAEVRAELFADIADLDSIVVHTLSQSDLKDIDPPEIRSLISRS